MFQLARFVRSAIFHFLLGFMSCGSGPDCDRFIGGGGGGAIVGDGGPIVGGGGGDSDFA